MIMASYGRYLPVSGHDHEKPHPGTLAHPFNVPVRRPISFVGRSNSLRADVSRLDFFDNSIPKRRMPDSPPPCLTRHGGRLTKLTNNNFSINLAFNS
jgi:hypothetical protein